MNPWFAKSVVLLANIVLIAIRAPYGHRSRAIRVTQSHKGALEVVLLTAAWAAFLLIIVWIATPVLAFADYTLHLVPLVIGTVCLIVGLWLFYRSHVDLGRNWSITLELREEHQLVTHGVFRSVRHPMYLALLVYGAGHALVVPNWIAGPAYGIAMIVLCAFRIGPEERMMTEEFGEKYQAYKRTTKRLFPGIW